MTIVKSRFSKDQNSLSNMAYIVNSRVKKEINKKQEEGEYRETKKLSILDIIFKRKKSVKITILHPLRKQICACAIEAGSYILPGPYILLQKDHAVCLKFFM